MNRFRDGDSLFFRQSGIDGIDAGQRDGGKLIEALSVKQRREKEAGGIGGTVGGGDLPSVDNALFGGESQKAALLGGGEGGK